MLYLGLNNFLEFISDKQNSSETQSEGNSHKEDQPTPESSSGRPETPNLSRPSTPLEPQQVGKTKK